MQKFVLGLVVLGACGSTTEPLATAEPGVVFSYPIDAQVDVPLGARIVVTFSDPVDAGALGACTATTGAFCIVGPDGPVAGTPEVVGDGKTVQVADAALAPGTTYQVFARPALSATAKNISDGAPLFSFTTRSLRPRAAAPALVAVNGGPPSDPEAFRPMLETSTIRLVFSEPLDPRTVTLGPGAIELVDAATSVAVPATLVADGIHVAIDPISDLAPGTAYELRLGSRLLDLGGTAVAASTIPLTPKDSGAASPIPQVLRTRQPNDPGPAQSRSGAEVNSIAIDKPLIGRETSTLQPAALAAKLGDPKALGGPIAFTIPRGQRLRASGLDIKLDGDIPAGLSTGDIQIELLTDAGGRLYRNPYQPADQRPENRNAPLYVDLSMDVAIFATDPTGNAVIAQTVLGVQATGTAVATDGVLAIETVAALDMKLLGVTSAPTNLVLELITDASATAGTDGEAPVLVATSPPAGTAVHAPGDGIELVFSEPIDLDRARAGGIRLETANGPVQTELESHGSTIVIRPLQRLPYSTSFQVVLADVADLAGNALADTTPVQFATQLLQGTGVPLTVAAVHPGVPCALTAGDGTTPGRCTGGAGGDDLYAPFTLPTNDPIDVRFTQPVNPATVTHGTACGSGSVRIEELDGAGNCIAPVAGTLIRRDRGLEFIPDVPWTVGTHYRLVLVSGGNTGCDAGELCGLSGGAASFDPLNGTGTGDGGGSSVVIDYVGAEATKATYMFAEAGPYTDTNGSGFVDSLEVPRDENRAALRITGTTGAVSDASFADPDCVPETPERENCLYLSGAMPVQLGEVQQNCPLPDGSTAPSCVPLVLSPETMFGTSLALSATVVSVFDITSDTGTSILRIREPAGGPVMGYIVDGGGTPKMVAALDLYMDAPDLSLPLSDHDLHSKPLSASLEGPVTFLPDGRIAIALTNVTDSPVTVNISAPLGIGGSVEMVLPAGQMKLQLVSHPLRGAEP